MVTGKTPSTQNLRYFGDKYPFVTPRDMVGQKRIGGTERYLSEEGMISVKNCLLPTNAICVSCIGSDMGKVVMTTQSSVTNQQLNSIICSDSFDQDFVYYSIVNISDELRNAAHHSTAVPILNKSAFSDFEIEAPELSTQHRIAAILSSLDDKIELNRQTNNTLEAIAQAIFNEWFVDFRFPGATGEMQESELGLIPNGWRVGKVGDICEVNKNILSNRDDIERIEYVEISEVSRGVIGKTTSYFLGTEPSRAKRKLKHGDTALSTVRPNRGAYFLALNPLPSLIASTGFAVFSPRTVPFGFLYLLLTDAEKLEYYGHVADGGAYPAINPNLIMDMHIVIPSAGVLDDFQSVAASLFEEIDNNYHQSTILSKTRDSLLPKLISGEIEV